MAATVRIESSAHVALSAIAMAKELIELKGAAGMWEPIIPGLVERTRGLLMQSNPGLSKDLGDVAAQLRKEYEPRRAEVGNEVAKVYAQHFSEWGVQRHRLGGGK